MASPRPTRPRLIVGAVALVATAAVAAIPLTDPGPLAPLVEVLAVLAMLSAAIGVVLGVPGWGAVAAVVLGAEFVATLHDRAPVVDGRTPVMAAGLLLVAELVTWSAEQRGGGVVIAGMTAPRPARLVACVVGAYVTAALLVTAVAVPLGRDLAVAALGAAAVAVVTVVLVTLARTRASG